MATRCGFLRGLTPTSRTTLAFGSPRGEYASVSGRAVVSDNRDVVQRLWNPTYRAWFPGGRQDPNIVLLRIIVERTDYWETSNSGVQRLFGVIKAIVSGEPYEIEKQQMKIRE
jgi:general stress protein 26